MTEQMMEYLHEKLMQRIIEAQEHIDLRNGSFKKPDEPVLQQEIMRIEAFRDGLRVAANEVHIGILALRICPNVLENIKDGDA